MTHKTRYEIKKTGRKFVMGESIRPKWADLRAVVLILDQQDMGRFLWPTMNIGIGTANKAQIEAAVPEILSNARFIVPSLTAPQKGCLWIVAWYNHIWLGGPRPKITMRPRLKRSAPTMIFKCPMCGDHWYPPKRIKTQGAAMRLFAKWIVKHSRVKYHDNKVTKRFIYRAEPWAENKPSIAVRKKTKRAKKKGKKK
jgi:hypothetical protein